MSTSASSGRREVAAMARYYTINYGETATASFRSGDDVLDFMADMCDAGYRVDGIRYDYDSEHYVIDLVDD